MAEVKYIKIALLFLMIPTFIYSFLYEKNDLDFILSMVGMLFILFVLELISRKVKRRNKTRIIRQNYQLGAKIESVNIPKRGNYILQLSFEYNDSTYITGYVHYNPNPDQKSKYRSGSKIQVYINPLNPYEIAIPESKRTSPTQMSGFLANLIVWGIISLAVIIPLLISFWSDSSVYQDMIYVPVGEKQNYMWVIKYESRGKIYIKVVDTQTNKKIKTIKDKKKEDEEDAELDLGVYRQNKNIVLVGYGTNPVLDRYDSKNYLKLSGISEFIQSNKKLRSGIARIDRYSLSSRFYNETIIELETNDGNKLFYNISRDSIFNSEKQLYRFIEQNDTKLMSEKLVSFVLSEVPDTKNQNLLYQISSTNKKDTKKMLEWERTSYFNIQDFDKNKRYYCKKCEARLIQQEPFLKSRFIYSDTSITAILSYTSVNQKANEEITGFDKTGKKIFHINKTQYPNYEAMEEDNFDPGSTSSLKCDKTDNLFIIYIDGYGAMGINTKSGSILWKYEP